MKPDISDINPETLQRLAQSNIKVMAKGQHFCIFVRDSCLAMVPWEEGIFAGIGSTGLTIEEGLGYLINRDGKYFLEGNTFDVPAQPEQVEKIQAFSADVKAALGLAE